MSEKAFLMRKPVASVGSSRCVILPADWVRNNEASEIDLFIDSDQRLIIEPIKSTQEEKCAERKNQ